MITNVLSELAVNIAKGYEETLFKSSGHSNYYASRVRLRTELQAALLNFGEKLNCVKIKRDLKDEITKLAPKITTVVDEAIEKALPLKVEGLFETGIEEFSKMTGKLLVQLNSNNLKKAAPDFDWLWTQITEIDTEQDDSIKLKSSQETVLAILSKFESKLTDTLELK